MHLIRRNHISTNRQWEYVTQLRQEGIVQRPEEIKSGGHYLYKEKHGMVALVKVIKKSIDDGWIDFTLLVKQVLFSPWEVRKGTVFEVGLGADCTNYPGSWHFEAGLAVIKSSKPSTLSFDEMDKPYSPVNDQQSVHKSAL